MTSNKPEYTPENIDILVETIVDIWDMETLLSYALEHLQEAYSSDKELFYKDWEEIFVNILPNSKNEE